MPKNESRLDSGTAPESNSKTKPDTQYDAITFARVVVAHSDMVDQTMHVEGLGWLDWRDGLWHIDKNAVRGRIAILVDRYSKRVKSNIRTTAILDEWGARPENNPHRIKPADFDRKPFLIGLGDNLVYEHFADNATAASQGYVRDAHPDDLCMRKLNYAPFISDSGLQDHPTKFLEFLRQMFRSLGDQTACEAGDLLCTLTGLALLGYRPGESFIFLQGEESAGKSTLCKLLHHIAGDYATGLNTSNLSTMAIGKHHAWLARLAGARLAIGAELPNRMLNTGLIKEITGGDVLTANRMRQDPFNFTFEGLMILAGNDRPPLDSADAALARRLILLPCTKAEHPRENYFAELKAETPNILGYMFDRATSYIVRLARGEISSVNQLVPTAITNIVEHYIDDESDPLEDFIASRIELNDQGVVRIGRLYESYIEFAGDPAKRTKRWQPKLIDAILKMDGVWRKSKTDYATDSFEKKRCKGALIGIEVVRPMTGWDGV